MQKNLENLVIAASTCLNADELDLDIAFKEGEAFHHLYIWDSYKPNNPRKIEIPYTGEGIYAGFSDMKIVDNKVIIANSDALFFYEMDKPDILPKKLENTYHSPCTNLLHKFNNKLI